MEATTNKSCGEALNIFLGGLFAWSLEGPRHMTHTLIWV